jgi:pentatricopeptide repeat protein
VITFGGVIAACAKFTEIQRAEKWLDSMVERKVKPNLVIYNTLVYASAKANNLAKAGGTSSR